MPGTYSGRATVTVAGRDGSVSETVAVTFNAEASRIVVGAEGVGLSVSPSRSVLSREVEVLSSLGRTDVRWEAASDSPWLAVTASGTTGGKLLLSADPAGLAAGQTHFATVTVTSPDAEVENSQTIRVGLHVLDADPPAATGVVAAGHHLVASPVEPVVFVSAGGTGVVAYDVYGGAVVRSFPSVVGRAFALATSGDGRRLFVQDAGATARVVELDADTGAVVREFPTPAVAGTNTNGGVYGPTGVQLAKFNSTTVTMYRSLWERGLAVSADGTRLVALVANQCVAGGTELRLHPLPAP